MAANNVRCLLQACLLSVFLCAVDLVALGAELPGRPDASSLVEKLARQKDSFPPYALQVETQSCWQAGEEKGADVHVYQVRWDGPRVDTIMDEHRLDGTRRIHTGSKRGVWDGRQYLFRQRLTTRSGEETAVQAAFSKDKAKAESLISSPFGGGFLAGYLDPDMHISERLRRASAISLRPAREEVKGDPCYVLTAQIEGTRYTLWIDPDRGFTIRRAVIEMTHPEAGPITRRLEDVEIGKVGDVWIPVSGTYTTSTTRMTIQSFASKRTGIVLHPDFEELKAFQMDGIPNGTHVSNLDHGGPSYIWQDGQMIPKESGETPGGNP